MSIYVELFNKAIELRKEFPLGTRVEAVFIDDIKAPPKGTKGTVVGVDDIATIFVDWDQRGYVAGVAYGVDQIKKLEEKWKDKLKILAKQKKPC